MLSNLHGKLAIIADHVEHLAKCTVLVPAQVAVPAQITAAQFTPNQRSVGQLHQELQLHQKHVPFA